MRYFFASTESLDGETLIPRLPYRMMVSEDFVTKRICVSQSINGCLTAIGGFEIGDKVFIYECYADLVDVYQPSDADVADGCFTGELWILKPVKLSLFMTLEIVGMMNSKLNKMDNIQYAFKLWEG